MSVVKLSRRNLLALLHKLEMKGSHSTIIKPGGIVVIAESDAVHYADRPAGPGPMHPETEAFLADVEEGLEMVRRKRVTGCCGGDCAGDCHCGDCGGRGDY